ncbi:MAG: 1-acyl-sn-glycerol-3-phosphate acyltransferase [Planctomycetes bacterium]|nr:1-acyl-sn-glycerol-3-phosphate acyltransferase [Planctomycetota bacterium]
MLFLRSAWRLFAIALATAFSAIGMAISALITRKHSPARCRCHAFWVGLWSRNCTKALKIRVQVEGKPPQHSFLLASNHLSYLDIIVLWCGVDCQFLSKADVARWPIFGKCAQIAGTLFVDRTRRTDLPRVQAEAKQVLDSGYGVIFFPEGTSSPGAEVMPFKGSLFQIAIDQNMPVHTACLHYSTPNNQPPAYETVCWWGDMGFFPHLLKLVKLPRVDARIRFQPQPVDGENRKQMAAAARQQICGAFEAIEGAPKMVWRGPDTP